MSRGLPSPNVKCKFCGKSPAWPTSQMCRGCITAVSRNGYTWTPEQDEVIRRAYAVKTKVELKEALDDAMRRIGRARSTINRRAETLGCQWVTKRTWTQQEIEFVREHASEWSVNQICRSLRRSHYSVLGAIARLKVSRRITTGYDQTEITSLLGVCDRTVRRWMQQGILRVEDGRVSEQSMLAFLHSHPELYSLKRVDEEWLKGMIFSGASCFRPRLKEAA